MYAESMKFWLPSCVNDAPRLGFQVVRLTCAVAMRLPYSNVICTQLPWVPPAENGSPVVTALRRASRIAVGARRQRTLANARRACRQRRSPSS